MPTPIESSCSKCGGGLEPGFILDALHGSYKAAEWVKGDPEKSLWVGLKLSDRVRYRFVHSGVATAAIWNRMPADVYRLEVSQRICGIVFRFRQILGRGGMTF
jgi:hypothetical protein